MDVSQEWDRVTPKLYGYLINTVRDKALAEDILQTTWLKALRALPEYVDQGKGLGPWLFAIAKNECRQHWRSDKHDVPLEIAEHDLGLSPSSDHILAEQVLAKLPPDDQELLRLRYIADLSMSDIANILQTNSVAVRVRLHRALKRATALNHD